MIAPRRFLPHASTATNRTRGDRLSDLSGSRLPSLIGELRSIGVRIILPTPLGTDAGWLSVSQFTEGTLQSMTVTVSGYPQDEPRTTVQGRGTTQWRDASRLIVESNRLLHTADTTEGQSGSAVFGYFPEKKDKYQAVGIHNWGHSAFNAATRINAAVFAQIFRWRELSDSGTR